MSDDERIGGGDRSGRHLALFCFGVVVGTIVRLAEWALPARLERAVKQLLP